MNLTTIQWLFAIVGGGVLLLLNGQYFTNCLIFVACMALNVTISMSRPGFTERRSWLIWVFLLFVGLANLKPSYDAQIRFNERAREAKQDN